MSLDFNFNLNIGEDKTPSLNNTTLFDVLVIGGGPAGLNAALYSKRKGLDVGIIAKKIGGQVTDTSSVENYLGFESKTGEGLVHEFVKHVKSLDIPIAEDYEIVSITNEGSTKVVHLENGSIYKAKSLILTTGSRPRRLGVPGENEYMGRGVAYCAICDGPLFTGLDIVVAGGGNSAVEAALDMSKIASKVTLIHRSKLRADSILIDQLNNTPNIEVLLEATIKEVVGGKLVSALKVIDNNSNELMEIPTNGLFVEIGYLPNTQLFEGLVDLNSRGEILINERNETSVEGIFAAGDATTIPYKQIIIATGEGAKAALAVTDYLRSLA